MTIREFTDKNNKALPPELAKTLNDSTEIWSNSACYGFLIEAMEKTGYDRKKIMAILPNLKDALDEMPIEDAERKWNNW